MNRLVSLCLIVLLVTSVSVPTVAQNSEEQTDDQEILTIVENERVAEIEKVEQWLQSVDADEYPTLYDEAQEFVQSTQEQNEDLTEKYSGYENVSQNVDIEGWEFDRVNETVNFVLEVDEYTTITLQDVASIITEGSFSYEVKRLSAGTYEFNYSAKEVRVENQLTQQISIVDTDEQQGTVLRRSQDTISLFNGYEWWMIPLAGVSGSGALALLSIRYIRKKEEIGKDELIPSGSDEL